MIATFQNFIYFLFSDRTKLLRTGIFFWVQNAHTFIIIIRASTNSENTCVIVIAALLNFMLTLYYIIHVFWHSYTEKLPQAVFFFSCARSVFKWFRLIAELPRCKIFLIFLYKAFVVEWGFSYQPASMIKLKFLAPLFDRAAGLFRLADDKEKWAIFKKRRKKANQIQDIWPILPPLDF